MPNQDRLAEYGRNLGIALRISNDVVGLIDGDLVTGRQPGYDLITGNYTLPVIFALEEDAELAKLLARDAIGGSIQDAVKRIRGTRAVERCLAECKHYEAAARTALDGLAIHREALDALAELAADRIRGMAVA